MDIIGIYGMRKSIGGGMRLSVGKRGIGISAGGKAARISIGQNGKRATVSIPGTGLSYSRKIGKRSQSRTLQTPPPLVNRLTPEQVEHRAKINKKIFKVLGTIILLIIAISYAI
jgi:hypothetical protein